MYNGIRMTRPGVRETKLRTRFLDVELMCHDCLHGSDKDFYWILCAYHKASPISKGIACWIQSSKP